LKSNATSSTFLGNNGSLEIIYNKNYAAQKKFQIHIGAGGAGRNKK
jgi:hypothetical protein